jgi:hypothetical protein
LTGGSRSSIIPGPLSEGSQIIAGYYGATTKKKNKTSVKANIAVRKASVVAVEATAAKGQVELGNVKRNGACDPKIKLGTKPRFGDFGPMPT